MADDTHSQTRKPGTMNLSARLLVLTIAFVMLAEVLIWTPSIARYRKDFIDDYIAKAYLSMLALDSMPTSTPDRQLETELLEQVRARAIILNRPTNRNLMVGGDMPPAVDLTVDMRYQSFVDYVVDAFETLAMTENRVIRAIGMPPGNPNVTIEVLFDEQIMRDSMLGFSTRILNLSIIISLFTAALVYISLQWMIVRPIGRLTDGMTQFRKNPEDATRLIEVRPRSDEIGVAQQELRDMQQQVQDSLRQKNRLAALGTVMAKVNHDLRNTLATAVLVSDKLQYIEDPEVKRVTPRLMKAIDRAIDLCSQTLNYASDDGLVLRPRAFGLYDLIDEIKTTLELDNDAPHVDWTISVPEDLDIVADRRHLLRALQNMCNNALQAGATSLRVVTAIDSGRIHIDVIDNGPGLPEKAQEHLFEPFAGSAKKGGTGLGLVIVREIVTAHGGDACLLFTGEDGTAFRIDLPGDIRPHAADAA